jgi:hypothetical protein
MMKTLCAVVLVAFMAPFSLMAQTANSGHASVGTSNSNTLGKPLSPPADAQQNRGADIPWAVSGVRVTGSKNATANISDDAFGATTLVVNGTVATGNKIVVIPPPDPNAGNCFPFGCAYKGEYQQVYTASLFRRPIKITGLQFYDSQTDTGATTMNDGTWQISLSTTSADWNTLSAEFTDNVGADNTVVFRGTLLQPWTFPYTLNIPLKVPYIYDPAAGNLLLDIKVKGASELNGQIFFDTNGYNDGGFNGNTVMGRVSCGLFLPCRAGNISVDSGYGLITGFVVRPVTTD